MICSFDGRVDDRDTEDAQRRRRRHHEDTKNTKTHEGVMVGLGVREKSGPL